MSGVQWCQGRGNIDLMPLSWLIERGCTQTWEPTVQLTTPTGQQLPVATWRGLPYLTSEQVATVMASLPSSRVKGRSGQPAGRRIRATEAVLAPPGHVPQQSRSR